MIRKYTLQVGSGVTDITLPCGVSYPRILSVQYQESNHAPQVWVALQAGNTGCTYRFHTFATGEEIPDRVILYCDYVGTYQYWNGRRVYHVYSERVI